MWVVVVAAVWAQLGPAPLLVQVRVLALVLLLVLGLVRVAMWAQEVQGHQSLQ